MTASSAKVSCFQNVSIPATAGWHAKMERRKNATFKRTNLPTFLNTIFPHVMDYNRVIFGGCKFLAPFLAPDASFARVWTPQGTSKSEIWIEALKRAKKGVACLNAIGCWFSLFIMPAKFKRSTLF